MKKKSIIITTVILIFIILIFGSLTGFPISVKTEKFGCSASYKKYLIPNTLCQYITFGHCPTNNLNKYNAEMKITHCLCNKYESEPNIDLQNEILSRCNMVKPDCDSSIERIQIDFCNKEGFNSIECNEYFSKIDTPKVNFICQNKEQIFYKTFID